MSSEIYYGVTQSVHGHEYRWIFEKSVLDKNIYDGASAPDHDVIDCGFPIAGSNSSSTTIQRLNTERAIKAFITGPAAGPDTDDPTLVEIGEYCVSVANNHDSYTDKFMQMFGCLTKHWKETMTSCTVNAKSAECLLHLKKQAMKDWTTPTLCMAGTKTCTIPSCLKFT